MEDLTVKQFGKEVDSGLWIKPREFATIVGWTPANVYYHCQNGTIKSLKVGGSSGHIWIPRSELDRVRRSGKKA